MRAEAVSGYREATRGLAYKFQHLQDKLEHLRTTQAQILADLDSKSAGEFQVLSSADKQFSSKDTKGAGKHWPQCLATAHAQPEPARTRYLFAAHQHHQSTPVLVPSSSMEWLGYKRGLRADLSKGPSYKSWLLRDLSNGLEDDFLAVSTHSAKLQSKPQSLIRGSAQPEPSLPPASHPWPLAASDVQGISSHSADPSRQFHNDSLGVYPHVTIPKANQNVRTKLQSKLWSSPYPESEGAFQEFTGEELAYIKQNTSARSDTTTCPVLLASPRSDDQTFKSQRKVKFQC
eukprot:gnl/MRDRNA2_/MRDRNA2_133825_c0_seq1.p1 gnl/MRDRNA2_/MRDRNA2_133825_c0~~gnl/MRDRNA2_/MRDRNA2_133825_c0_seq1.p1  ORF type:complete len:289 (+),score=45.75 gnl/MRDRNA2_/MRDRNA2_133825_c0_seq1:155-1021(+)